MSNLYISSHLPYHGVPQAGQKIAESNLHELFVNDVNTRAICFVNRIEKRYLKEFKVYNELHMPKIILVHNYGIIRIMKFILMPFLPVKLALRFSPFAVIQIAKSIANCNDKFLNVFLEYTASLVYLPLIFLISKLSGVKVNVTVFEHDITFQGIERQAKKAEGLKRRLLYIEFYRQKLFELWLLKLCDRIILMSIKDKVLLDENGIDSTVEIFDVISFFTLNLNIPTDEEVMDIRSTFGEYIVFFGAMDRVENIDAMKWFVDKMYPEVMKRNSLKLVIVGANPTSEICDLAAQDENITVTGFVDNPYPYLSAAKVGVAPLRLGAGVKIKVIEMIACKLCVVATSVASEGIDDHRLYTTDNPSEFVDMLIESLDPRGLKNVI